MKSYDVESKLFRVGDLVKYWDEWNEVYHLGMIIAQEDCDSVNGRWQVFFAGTIPGYLQPNGKYGRAVFSCHDTILQKI